jgi:hypothetical protein
VIRHDEQIRTLFTGVRELGARLTDAFRSRHEPPRDSPHDRATAGDRRHADMLPITRRDVVMLIAGAGLVISSLKFLAAAIGFLR